MPIVKPAPGATGRPATGGAAITPAGSAGITADEARSYVLSHRVPFALSEKNVAVSSISFLSAGRVSALLHSSRLLVPAGQPMCLVVMTGTFVFPGPPGESPTFPVGIEVFDARTGRLMQSGGLPRLPSGGARAQVVAVPR